MGIVRSLAGNVRIQITTADPTRLIAELNNSGVELQNVVSEDMLTVSGTIPRIHYAMAQQHIEKRGGQVVLLNRQGLYWRVKGLLSRPILLFGLLVILGLTMFLPTRVLFVQVLGNSSIPTRLILEKAEACGIGFGASRQDVRSEKLKNKLLSELPQLQWAGVNTSGCVATITVRERSAADTQQSQTGVSSIVASRDGIIEEITVTKGNPLCQVGQAVREGQTLVSGYTDCGISIKASQAEAEVYARTYRSLTVTSVQSAAQKSQILERKSFAYLVIGDHSYHLYGSVPADTDDCIWQKTYREHTFTLPGGFSIPVSLITGEYICYQVDSSRVSSQDEKLAEFAQSYILSQMVSGRIVGTAQFTLEDEEQSILKAEFSCVEMIGKVRWEAPIGVP